MADEITVIIEPSRFQVKSGEQDSATVVVRNRSEEVGNYWLRAEGIPADWFTFIPDQLSAFPLQETRARLTLHPQADARGATYHVTVWATLQERAGVESSALLEVDVPAARPLAPPPPPPPPEFVTVGPQAAVQIEVRFESVKDAPPPARQWRLMIRNAGNVLDSFSFNISGIRPTWVNIEPAQVTLHPGEEGTALLTVRPSDDTKAGPYPFTVRTFSHLNINQQTEIALKIDVQPSVGFKVSIFPREAEAQGQREFKVSLMSDPTANTDLWLDLSASDQDSACEYTFEPSQVFAPARQTVTSTLRIRPRGVLGPNERRTYTFTVVASARGLAPNQTAEARLTQVGATPLSLSLRPQIQTADQQAEYTVILRNPSGVETTLLLAAEDPEAGCEYAFQPSKLTLSPAGEAQAKLKVSAREYYDGEQEKSYPITVWATRLGELVPTAKVEGSFVQRPVKPVSLELIPPLQSRPGKATYFVRATNPRASPVEIYLEARDEVDALVFAFEPSLIRLSPGAEGRAALSVRPKDKLAPGEQRRAHKFTVAGRVGGSGKPMASSGTLAQVRGIDLGPGIAKLLRWIFWLLKWIIAIVIVIFIINLIVHGTDELEYYNPDLSYLFRSVTPHSVDSFVRGLPTDPLARVVVRFISQIVQTLTGS